MARLQLDFSKAALIVVDVQNDFCPGGALPVPDGDAVVPAINGYLGFPFPVVLATQDWHIDPGGHFSETPDYIQSWPVHCKAETLGAELHRGLYDFVIDEIFLKGMFDDAYSGFEGETSDGVGLERYLRERSVTTVIICGLATDYCVKATALDAVTFGFRAIVILDACRGVAPETTDAAIDEMEAAGVEIVDAFEWGSNE